VARYVCEKIAQNVAQPILVEINTQLQPWKKVSKKFGLLLYAIYEKQPEVNNRPIFAHAGHPGFECLLFCVCRPTLT
jgi:hypothetical protein